MKLKDLLNEVTVHQNNFVKIDMVEKELEEIFGDEAPKIKFDEEGLYIRMDNFLMRDYESNPMNSFTLTDSGFDNDKDEVKNIRRYYVEYTKIEKDETPPEEDETSPTEETPTEA